MPAEVRITPELVREIAANLGASEKLIEALVESMWSPRCSGGISGHIEYGPAGNRDQAVITVADSLENLWRRTK